MNDDDHMPTKEKPQPTAEQIALLHWWIDNGASFTNKVKQANQPTGIKKALLALQTTAPLKQADTDVPTAPVEQADGNTIKALASQGIVALPLAQNSNYLMVSFVTDTTVTAGVLKLIVTLKKQLAWLKLNNTNIGDTAMGYIAQLTALTRLDVANTRITDKGLQQLLPLKNLAYLNLTGTAVTQQGLLQLKTLPHLHSVYLYRTQVAKNAYAIIKSAFPKTNIDTGGYNVPTLLTDTTEVKAKKEY